MNKTALITGLIFSLAPLTGCVTHSDENKKTVDSSIDFNFKVENGATIGLVQTFVMGGNTTLQFRNIEAKNLEFIGSDNKDIPFKIVGPYAVLDGIHNDFIAISNSAAAKVSRTVVNQPVQANSTIRTQSREVADITVATAPSDAYLKREILRLQTEIGEIKKLLASANSNAVPTQIAANTVNDRQLQVQTYRISFKNNSENLQVPPDEKPTLITKAKTATAIKVKGFTDSSVSNSAGERLAKNRALAAKKFLISNGVRENKIDVSFEAAGGFIMDNSTPEGRDANRRVEIALM